MKLLPAALSILCSLSLAGCIAPAVKPPESEKPVVEAPADDTAGSASGRSAKGFLFPDPGPFKLVTDKDGNELWQARGDLGDYGGTLKLVTFGTGPKTFNGWDASDVESHGIGMLQDDSLVDIDPWTGKPIPKLAKSFSLSPDCRTITFVLRKGLKWSDGQPLNADDIVFTFDKIIKEGFGEGSNKDSISVPGDYPVITKKDDLTVEFKFKKPFSPFLSNLNAIMIAPKHAMIDAVKKGQDYFHTFWNVNADPRKFVGCGPFIISSYVAGQRVEFKRNPNYHMIDKEGRRLPYLNGITIGIVPDQRTVLLKFLGNEVDLLDVKAIRGSDAYQMKSKAKRDNFTLRSLGSDDGTVFLAFNMCRRKNPKTGKYYVNPIKQQWFNDRNFRWAVSHAVDRKGIVNNVMKGVGYPLSTCETEASLYHNSALKPIEFSLEKSQKLLAESGFVKKGDELYDKKGNRVEFDLMTNSGNSVRDAISITIKESLKKLGIKVNYQPIDFNIMTNKTHNSLDWEAVMMGLSGSRLEPYSGANIWKSGGRMHIFDQRLPGPDNKITAPDARAWEKVIDECYDTAAASYDEAVRRKYFNLAEETIYNEQPFIYVNAVALLTAAHDRLGNYKPTPYGLYYTPKGSMHNIEEIYIKGVKH